MLWDSRAQRNWTREILLIAQQSMKSILQVFIVFAQFSCGVYCLALLANMNIIKNSYTLSYKQTAEQLYTNNSY